MNEYTVNGFSASGVAAGLKKNNRLDLGLITSDVPAAVAGVFTKNRVQAAPVRICRERIAAGSGIAFVANSGCANCCVGDDGLRNARVVTGQIAQALGISEENIFPASTGVIGMPLNTRKIVDAIPGLTAALRSDGFLDFARAIMTTDTVPKISSAAGAAAGRQYRIVGVAKGAGMIRPDMATMLCFVCTDAAVAAADLQPMLANAVDRSFNRITIDGDTSTNDTVLVMANGRSDAKIESDEDRSEFQSLLTGLLQKLARELVADGEGVTKVVDIQVRGAAGRDDAERVADAVAHSPLVKTALFGADANWGRIIAAAGRAGVELDPDRIDIFFDDVQMVRRGVGCGDDTEQRASQVLKKPSFTIVLDLHQGKHQASLLTCDFSIDYVKINADYRS